MTKVYKTERKNEIFNIPTKSTLNFADKTHY